LRARRGEAPHRAGRLWRQHETVERRAPPTYNFLSPPVADPQRSTDGAFAAANPLRRRSWTARRRRPRSP